jgi:hypothetical protein
VPDGGQQTLRCNENLRWGGVVAHSPATSIEVAGHNVRAGDAIITTLLPIVDRGPFFARAHPERSYAIAV